MMVRNSETKSNRGRIAAVGLLAALGAFASVPASALPAGMMGAGVAGPAAELPVENVRCRGCAVGVGVAAGVIAGAAIAGAVNNNRRNYYYEEPEVIYAPRAYAPAPRYGRCWVQQGPYRGEGYWVRC